MTRRTLVGDRASGLASGARWLAGRRRRWIGLLAVLALVVAACSSAASVAPRANDSGTTTESYGQGGPAGFPSAAASAAPAPADLTGVGAQNQTAQGDQLLVIKTGQLDLQVKDLDPALTAATAKVTEQGGYVSGSQRSGDGDKAYATITYRIPAAHWDATVAALRAIGTKVLGEQTQTDEVTGQVIDLGARITNLQATEKALQAIMDRATKISDVLDVQQQLTDVRGQIEELTTQKQHLEGQAAYGTLVVNFGLGTPAVVIAQTGFDPSSEFDRAVAALVNMGQSVLTWGIWFAVVWLPALIVLGFLALIVLFIGRRVRRSRVGGGRPDAVVPTAGV